MNSDWCSIGDFAELVQRTPSIYDVLDASRETKGSEGERERDREITNHAVSEGIPLALMLQALLCTSQLGVTLLCPAAPFSIHQLRSV